jgi:ribonuclease-3
MAQPKPIALEAALGYSFERQQLLLQALTHRSLVRESLVRERVREPLRERRMDEPERTTAPRRPKRAALTEAGDAAADLRLHASPGPGAPELEQDNERLEFLGDAVLGMVVAEILFHRFPELREGEWTRLRANLVSRSHMARVASILDLGAYLRLGKGEERSGGRRKAALLANCIEAIVAAMYLDGGLQQVKGFVQRHVVEPYLSDLREALDLGGPIGDHKTALQEILQARRGGRPEYVLRAESGPDHRKRFLIEVRVQNGKGNTARLARGMGTTKKRAEQEAARRAVRTLQRREETGLSPAFGKGNGP